jgi:tRNA-Thr(GGU) m(6)t(6)A37 methyltransferase TsaA
MSYDIVPIGKVQSPLTDKKTAPKQGHEGSPEATLVFEERVLDALYGLAVGDQVILLTWLDRADREVLKTRPRDDPANPIQGVFNTRSPDRPNPIGLHPVTILAIDGNTMRVRDLEALDGTPIVDVKPVL